MKFLIGALGLAGLLLTGWALLRPAPPVSLTPREPDMVGALVGALGVTLLICSILLAWFTVPALRWLRQAKARHPNAMVILCQPAETLEPAMRKARLPIGSMDLPTYFPLVVDSTGLKIGLQSGSEQLIPWSMIRSIDVGKTYIRYSSTLIPGPRIHRTVPSITVLLNKPEDQAAVLDLIPCRPRLELFAILNRGKARQVVDRILRARVTP